eukprot:Tbor_TRINITY_DN5252_c3_g3::TRINITY_DN5252_c3_g3_i2::g.16142::m.16142
MRKKDIKISNFTWEKASKLYEINGTAVNYKENGEDKYRPVIGSLAMPPNTGEYFFEYYINCDNTRVGLCTDKVDLNGEMGKLQNCQSLNIQTGVVDVNGKEVKRIWRLVAPISGGKVGFLVNTNDGSAQFFWNGVFMATCFDVADNLKGQTLYPCVGIAGIELNNRNIGFGKKSAVVTVDPKPYKMFAKMI